jgi:hypothetical protein
MENLPTLSEPEAAAPSSRDFELGQWIGRHQAFGMMSGKSGAADAECLRRIRDEKLYKGRTTNWSEFCARYVGASKTQVNLMIRHLEEFGPQFFELSALTRITPAMYRAIAGQVTAQGLLLDGETIPLSQENSERISEAVSVLRRRVAPPEPAPAPADAFADAEKNIEAAIAALNGVSPLDAQQKVALTTLVMRLRASAASVGVYVIW